MSFVPLRSHSHLCSKAISLANTTSLYKLRHTLKEQNDVTSRRHLPPEPRSLWSIRTQTYIYIYIYIFQKAIVGNFFDDCFIILHSILDRQRSMDQSLVFDDLTGQRVGHKNTVAFSSPQATNDELLSRGEGLKSVRAEKALGILMEVH